MASREDSGNERQASGELSSTNNTEILSTVSLPWDQPPFCWLNPQQQLRFKDKAQTCRYKLGDKIWPTDSLKGQFLVVSGKVRFREERATKALVTLRDGDWFGDALELSWQLKVVAADEEVVVIQWDTLLWAEISSPEIERFWQQARSRIQSPTPDQPQPTILLVNCRKETKRMLEREVQLYLADSDSAWLWHGSSSQKRLF